MVRYAQCCQPVPGDPVVGYVTQGRGISIHRADCPNLLTLSADDRRVEIDWQEIRASRSRCGWRQRRGPPGLYADIMAGDQPDRHQHPAADLHTKDGSVFGTDLRRGGQPAPPRQGDEGGAAGEGRAAGRAA